MYNLLRHSRHTLFPTEFHKEVCLKLIESSPGRLLPLNDLVNLAESLARRENRKRAGFYPRGLGKLVLRYLFLNQSIRWAFKRLLFFRLQRQREKQTKTLIANDYDLVGDPLPEQPSRRTLVLWDNASSRYYVFPWSDIYNIFKCSILADEPTHPKNPYTNIRFSKAQLVKIREFFLSNIDRMRPSECSIMAYLRWNKISVVHAYNMVYHCEQRTSFGEDDIDTETEASTLLLDAILSQFHLVSHKKQFYDEIRKAYLLYCHSNLYKDSIFVPYTKAEFFIFNHISSLDCGNYDFLDTWSCKNEQTLVFGGPHFPDMDGLYSAMPYIPCKDYSHSPECEPLPNPFENQDPPPRVCTKRILTPNPFSGIVIDLPPSIDPETNRIHSTKKRNRV
jgi:hypothetical protein